MKFILSIITITLASQVWSQSKLVQSEIQIAAVQTVTGGYTLKGNLSYYSRSLASTIGENFLPGLVYQFDDKTSSYTPLSIETQNPIIYPNPTKGDVFVDGILGQPKQAELLTVDGRLIQKLGVEATRLDLSQTSAGIYLLKVYDGTSWTFHKIIKEQ